MGSLQSLIGPHRLDALGAWAVTGFSSGASDGSRPVAARSGSAHGLLVAIAVTVPPAARDLERRCPRRYSDWSRFQYSSVRCRIPDRSPRFLPRGARCWPSSLSVHLTDDDAAVRNGVRRHVTMAVAGVWAFRYLCGRHATGTASRWPTGWCGTSHCGAAGLVAGDVVERVRPSSRFARLRARLTRRRLTSRTVPSWKRLADHRRCPCATAVLGYYLQRTSESDAVRQPRRPLAITFLPALFRREYGYGMNTGLVLWITVASTLHAAGAFDCTKRLAGTTVWPTPSRRRSWPAWDTRSHEQSNATPGRLISREFRATFVVLVVLASVSAGRS